MFFKEILEGGQLEFWNFTGGLFSQKKEILTPQKIRRPPLAPWGAFLGLRNQDPLLVPPSTRAEIFRRTCLQSHFQTSPPTPQKSYSKIRNPMTTFENTPFFHPTIA